MLRGGFALFLVVSGHILEATHEVKTAVAVREQQKQQVIDQLATLGGLICVLAITSTANAVVTARRLRAAQNTHASLVQVQDEVFRTRNQQCAESRYTLLQVLVLHVDMGTFVSAELGEAGGALRATMHELEELVEDHVNDLCHDVGRGEQRLAVDVRRTHQEVQDLGSKLYIDSLRAVMSLMLVASSYKMEYDLQKQAANKDPSNGDHWDQLPSGVQDQMMAEYNAGIQQGTDAIMNVDAAMANLVAQSNHLGVSKTSQTVVFTGYTVMWALVMASVSIPVPEWVPLAGGFVATFGNALNLYRALKAEGVSGTDLLIAELNMVQTLLSLVQTALTFFGGAFLPVVAQAVALLAIAVSSLALLQNIHSGAQDRKKHEQRLQHSQDLLARFRVKHTFASCHMLTVADALAAQNELAIRGVDVNVEVSAEDAQAALDAGLSSAMDRLCQRAPRLCYDLLQRSTFPERVRKAYRGLGQLRERVTQGPISDLASYNSEEQRTLLELAGFEPVYPGLMLCRGCTTRVIVDVALVGEPPSHARCCCEERSVSAAGQTERTCLSIPSRSLNWRSHCPASHEAEDPSECGHRGQPLYLETFGAFSERLVKGYRKPVRLHYVQLPAIDYAEAGEPGEHRFLGFYTQPLSTEPGPTEVTDLRYVLSALPDGDGSYFDLRVSVDEQLAEHSWRPVMDLPQPPWDETWVKRSALHAGQLVVRSRPRPAPSAEAVFDRAAITGPGCRLDPAWRDRAHLLWSEEQLQRPPLHDWTTALDVWAVAPGSEPFPQSPHLTECRVFEVIPLDQKALGVKVASVNELRRGHEWPTEGVAGWYPADPRGPATCCCGPHGDGFGCDWVQKPSARPLYRRWCPRIEGPDGKMQRLHRKSSSHCPPRKPVQFKDLKIPEPWRAQRTLLELTLPHPMTGEEVVRTFLLLAAPADASKPALRGSKTLVTDPRVRTRPLRPLEHDRAPAPPSAVQWKDIQALQEQLHGAIGAFRGQIQSRLEAQQCSFADESLGQSLAKLGIGDKDAPPLLAAHAMALLTSTRSDLRGIVWDERHCNHAVAALHAESVGSGGRAYFRPDAPGEARGDTIEALAKGHGAVATVFHAADNNGRGIARLTASFVPGRKALKKFASHVFGKSCDFELLWHVPTAREQCPGPVSADGRQQAHAGRVGLNVETLEEFCLGNDEGAVDSYVVQWSGGVAETVPFAKELRRHGFVLAYEEYVPFYARDLASKTDIEYAVSSRTWVRYDPRLPRPTPRSKAGPSPTAGPSGMLVDLDEALRAYDEAPGGFSPDLDLGRHGWTPDDLEWASDEDEPEPGRVEAPLAALSEVGGRIVRVAKTVPSRGALTS